MRIEGVYKIINTITKQEYIGSSVDIKRRWQEHRTPKACGNDSLHMDMKIYGLENFQFVVLEVCEGKERHRREYDLIRQEQPYYNRIGKPIADTVRVKISRTIKKWWRSLPEETKDKIITNNLTGPSKGHPVSEETREKLRRFNREKVGIRVRIIETGECFDQIRHCEEYLGTYKGAVNAHLAGKIKSVNGYHVEKCRD